MDTTYTRESRTGRKWRRALEGWLDGQLKDGLPQNAGAVGLELAPNAAGDAWRVQLFAYGGAEQDTPVGEAGQKPLWQGASPLWLPADEEAKSWEDGAETLFTHALVAYLMKGRHGALLRGQQAVWFGQAGGRRYVAHRRTGR